MGVGVQRLALRNRQLSPIEKEGDRCFALFAAAGGVGLIFDRGCFFRFFRGLVNGHRVLIASSGMPNNDAFALRKGAVMVKKILVATDGSAHARKAIAYASDIASRYDATIYLIHVVPDKEIPEDVRHYIEIEGIKESPEQVYFQKIGEGILQAGEKAIRESGVRNLQTAVLQGDPAERIIEFAKDQGVDMIVIGSRGLGGVKQMFLGSVSNKVCHVADRTCVTVK
jgi:nucleotide-binding universal stress UspA family protein